MNRGGALTVGLSLFAAFIVSLPAPEAGAATGSPPWSMSAKISAGRAVFSYQETHRVGLEFDALRALNHFTGAGLEVAAWEEVETQPYISSATTGLSTLRDYPIEERRHVLAALALFRLSARFDGTGCSLNRWTASPGASTCSC